MIAKLLGWYERACFLLAAHSSKLAAIFLLAARSSKLAAVFQLVAVFFFTGSSLSLSAQSSWFVDGYHGGVWGHYPKGYTSFLLDQLQRNPHWNINLEIEPVTWDSVKKQEPANYAAWQSLLVSPEGQRRIEYVNPGYGQSYLYNTSGESIIRQLSYGMKQLREHFPGMSFSTYSSEEPCFTSALPQILNSFGFKYASLKNPNTGWGGYTRAQGGELVNWIGPDGSRLLTVPRYASEALEEKSTWQTIAWANSPAYINAATQQGVQHPVGMCLQDAGWRNGPWLGNRYDSTRMRYTTWRHYFEQVADEKLATNWDLSQEDIQVSLVWGAQVLQRIAQQVRQAEDKLVATEKIAAMAAVQKGFSWPQEAFDRAWQNLLLAQHHDCWIVPYNGRRGDTWADKVKNWTGETLRICDSINAGAARTLADEKAAAIQVINTSALGRQELVTLTANGDQAAAIQSVQLGRQRLPVQWTTNEGTGKKELLFKAAAPSTGSQLYTFTNKKLTTKGARVALRNNVYVLETDHYRLTIDPRKGGAITSLVSKQLQNKEWINGGQGAFNTLQGNFYNDGGRLSTAGQPATVAIIEEGPLRVKVKISGTLAGQSFHQTIALTQGEPRIDCTLQIDWEKNTAVGDNYKQDNTYKAEEYRKAFYNDREKLLLLFPVDLSNQAIHKNAPFDVTASRLDNTFFTTWDSIKNNVILHWVDVTDGLGNYGLALFTDHTTAYVHGAAHPLGLVVQYNGKGLWGRNYTVEGPTAIQYSLLPHKGQWDAAQLEAERTKLAEPLQAFGTLPDPKQPAGKTPAASSLVQLDQPGWELTTMTMDGKDLLVRLYNATGSEAPLTATVQAPVTSATVEHLDGRTTETLTIRQKEKGTVAVQLTASRFGIRTIRFKL